MDTISNSKEIDPARLDLVIEECLTFPSTSFARCASLLKQMLQAGDIERAAAWIRRAAMPSLDYTSAQSLCRLLRQCRRDYSGPSEKIKLALLSSFTSAQLAELLELFLFAGGVEVELYEAEYGVFRQEILDPESRLYRFKPRVIFVGTTWRDLGRSPGLNDDLAVARQLVAAEQAEWLVLWETAYKRLGCQIVQNNFDRPAWTQLANHEMRHHASFGQFITQVNQSLQGSAPPYVTIHDLDALSALVGRRTWNDERFFHHAKMPCAPQCLVEYAHSLSSLILSQLGLAKKCLVLDLDNTLWGGIIGDDGMGGIRVGQGDAEGESFLAFQRYVRKLRERGVILAVCSKNTEAVAREVFESHPGMLLSLEDISCFIANWEDKPRNVQEIARRLNIGLSSMVFLDDNAAERAIVRRVTPELAVPEVSGDPLDFIRAIEEHRYFQLVTLGNEDLKRTQYYHANDERQRIEASTQNLDDFLRSLRMAATIAPVNELTLERSAQLINKSNQFNLTTIRRSAAELLVLAMDPAWTTRTVSLKDRFGDNGLISVLLAKKDGDALFIDTWLMSCRVLKRNVEQLLLDHVCECAMRQALRVIRGCYIATKKNSLVKDHYTSLGFRPIPDSGEGQCFELELAGRKRFDPCITLEEI